MAKNQGGGPNTPGLYLNRMRKRTKGSSTSGKSKGLVPTPGDRSMAKRARAYKDPEYEAWAAKRDGKKIRKGK